MERYAWLTPDEVPGALVCRVLRIPDDGAIIAAVTGAIVALTEAGSWEQFGSVTVEEITAAMLLMYEEFATCMFQCVYPGTVAAWGSDEPPQGWLLCDGSDVAIDDYPRLYAAIGERFGSSPPAGMFYLPDLRGRWVAGPTDDGEIWDVGDTFGERRHALTVAEMPAHSHSEGTAAPGLGGTVPGAGAIPAGGITGSVGGGLEHENRPPTLVLHWIIAT